MPVTRQHRQPYPEAPRARDLPDTPVTAAAGSDRDPRTGRFQPGNTASRRRAFIRIARQLPWLDADQCAEWVRPYITSTREHAADLLADLGAAGPLASPLAEELATARLVYRALLQLGLTGDMEALEAARSWLREARQTAITLEHMARQHRAEQPATNPVLQRILDAGSDPKEPQP